MMDEMSARPPADTFAVLLRRLRAEARVTQEELAEAAGLSPRSISDLERGVSRTTRRETARLLADALDLAGPVRTAFVAAARGKAPACEVLAAVEALPAGPVLGAAHSRPQQDLEFALHDAGLGQLIDAIASAACRGRAVTWIWLVGLTTVIPVEMTPSRPDVAAVTTPVGNKGVGADGRAGRLRSATDLTRAIL